MEDFDSVFTVECYMSKGWEVVYTTNLLSEAIDRLRQECNDPLIDQVRLTTPKFVGVFSH